MVIKSVDSGKTWQTLQSPISQNLNDLLVADKDCFFGVGDSWTILMTINSGDTWHFENNILGFTENLYALSFPGEGSWYAGAIVGSSQTTITGGSTACSISLFDSIRGSHGVFWDVCMLTQENWVCCW